MQFALMFLQFLLANYANLHLFNHENFANCTSNALGPNQNLCSNGKWRLALWSKCMPSVVEHSATKMIISTYKIYCGRHISRNFKPLYFSVVYVRHTIIKKSGKRLKFPEEREIDLEMDEFSRLYFGKI